MNISNISTQLMFTTIPIFGITSTNKQQSGTGFIFAFSESDGSSIPLLVTNYHVLEGITKGILEFNESDGDLPKKGSKVRVEFDASILSVYRPFTDIDLIAIPLGPLLNNLQAQKKSVFFKSISKEIIPTAEEIENFGAVEEIVFIGYPIGLYDEINYSPIVRRGITATPLWNNFKGKEIFLIDAGVFPGSSGSPVFILNEGAYSTSSGLIIGSRVKFIGVLTSAITKNDPSANVFIGIGEVIKSDRVFRYLQELVDRLRRGTN
ncbi:MAG: trypsin-like peptidase domain-containing protein [Nitrospirae bacterium]|nr:trypsin-like peptidase domain-containing protein [Nitrospirota bacterium]